MSAALKIVHSDRNPAAVRGLRRPYRRSRAHLRLVGQPVTGRCSGASAHPPLRGVDVVRADEVAAATLPAAWPQRPEKIRRPRLAGAPAAPTHALAITRRGRLLVFAMVVAIVAVALLKILGGITLAEGAPSQAVAAPAAEAGGQVVTVLPGQTLWEIAGQVAPDRDPRDVVIDVRDANGLTDSRVFAGQQLTIPAG